MKRIAFIFAALLCLASCVEDDLFVINDLPNEECKPSEFEEILKPIRISASSVEDAPAADGPSRTYLDGLRVLWGNGDKIKLVNPKEDILQLTVDGQQAFGIYYTSNDITSAQVKYSDIKFEVDGVDKTEEVINNSDNDYKVGINDGGKYRYTPANTPVSAEVRSKRIIPLIRVGSKSPIINRNTVVVTLKNIEYLTNKDASWQKFNSTSQFRNGRSFGVSGVSDVQKYEWFQGMNADLSLASEPGSARGQFKGETEIVDINEQTIAVFPYNAFKSYESNTISLKIPEKQTYAEGSFDNKAYIMVGKPEKNADGEYSVAFKNMCGVLQLSLTGDCEIGSIKITDKGGRNLWGTINMEGEQYAEGISATNLVGGSSTVSMECNTTLTSEAKTFHFVVPVGAFENGLDIEVASKDGKQLFRKSSSGNNKILRNDLKKMPVLNVELLDTYTLENEAVVKYFSYGPYANYGDKSYFTTYSSALSGMYDKDDPKSVPLSWTGDASKTYTISLTYKNDEGVNTTKTYTTTGTSYNAYNLVPGKKYSYTVKDGDDVVKTSAFYTTGQVRMVTIEDSWNYRDIGGWTGLNGKKIKYEWIYRGGSLNGKFDTDPIAEGWIIKKTKEYNIVDQTQPSRYDFGKKSQREVLYLGIKSELDLRTTRQEENNDKLSDIVHAWSLGQNNTGIDDWNFFHIKTTGASEPMSNYAVIKDVAWIINEVVNKKRPVAFHCKSGADRTGMVGIAIEALLGVAPGDMARDYELTNFSSEQGVVTIKHELRDRKADDSSKEAYKFHKAIFKDDANNPGTNYQEKMYYYLNQKFKNQGVAINATDLDKFIKFMLGLDSYSHPSWATDNGNSLESIYSHQ